MWTKVSLLLLLCAACSGDPPAPPPDVVYEVDTTAYERDLAQIGASPRNVGSTNWRATQNLCATRLEALGYQVRRQSFAGGGVNIIGTLEGSARAHEQVLLSAHYDSIEGCAGADDNGSGVAGLLEGARLLAAAGPYERTLVVACWDLEEWRLAGSAFYAEQVTKASERIVTNFVFEMIGYTNTTPNSQAIPEGLGLLYPSQARWIVDRERRGDFVAVAYDQSGASTQGAKRLAQVGAALGLPVLRLPVSEALRHQPLAADLSRSDHAAFWEQGLSAMMITDTANLRNTHYHCEAGPDSVDRLDSAFATKVIQATVGSAWELLAP